ncbi:olfactory receptor 2AP1-like [Discoglossus pictus]
MELMSKPQKKCENMDFKGKTKSGDVYTESWATVSTIRVPECLRLQGGTRDSREPHADRITTCQIPVPFEGMDQKNLTTVTYFIIKGISDVPELQVPIFLLILLIYLLTLGGNMTILLVVYLDTQLHTPMYFFLGNLSFLDMTSSTVTLHSTIVVFITGDNTVSFLGCMTQLLLFLYMTTNELLLLTAMSYDRYVAICVPLSYTIIMRNKVCALLAISCWLTALAIAIPYVGLLSSYSCYASNMINHFYCDLIPVMKLSCSDTSSLEILIFTEGLVLSCLTTLLLAISYVFIIVTILKIPSNTGRRKAFYTCSSHLTVVVLLYLTLILQYLR